jgi:hypothetical protein
MMQHEVVAVGVGEERHVANAGIEGLPGELDSLGLELGASRRHVVNVKRGVGIFWGENCIPNRSGSQMPKQVSPAQNSKRPRSSALSPSVST